MLFKFCAAFSQYYFKQSAFVMLIITVASIQINGIPANCVNNTVKCVSETIERNFRNVFPPITHKKQSQDD